MCCFHISFADMLSLCIHISFADMFPSLEGMTYKITPRTRMRSYFSLYKITPPSTMMGIFI